MSLSKRALSLFAASAALAMSSAAMADAIVVRTSGPSAATYPVGHRLPSTARVVLRAGDRVVLVGDGGTRTLSGPGNFPVRATTRPGQGRSSTLGRYLSSTDGSISRTGAVRGADGPLTPPNIWLVDVARGGTWCTSNAANLQLWRADTAAAGDYVIENVADPAQRATIGFIVDQAFRSWPTETMPIAAGATYRISGPGLATPTLISVSTVAVPSEDAGVVATSLAEQGCTTQLSLLGAQIDGPAS